MPHAGRQSYQPPVNEHGTHVAGNPRRRLARAPTSSMPGNSHSASGRRPDRRLPEPQALRPARRSGRRHADEFAVLAALEFLRFLNRATASCSTVHGREHELLDPPRRRELRLRTHAGLRRRDEAGDLRRGRGRRGRQRGLPPRRDDPRVAATATGPSASHDPGNCEVAITVGSTHGYRPYAYGVSVLLEPRPDRRRPHEAGPRRARREDLLAAARTAVRTSKTARAWPRRT